jgi:hypothetical protein
MLSPVPTTATAPGKAESDIPLVRIAERVSRSAAIAGVTVALGKTGLGMGGALAQPDTAMAAANQQSCMVIGGTVGPKLSPGKAKTVESCVQQ